MKKPLLLLVPLLAAALFLLWTLHKDPGESDASNSGRHSTAPVVSEAVRANGLDEISARKELLAEVSTQRKSVSKENPSQVVRVLVLGPDGKPLAGASVGVFPSANLPQEMIEDFISLPTKVPNSSSETTDLNGYASVRLFPGGALL